MGGVAGFQLQLYTGAQINYGDITLYLPIADYAVFWGGNWGGGGGGMTHGRGGVEWGEGGGWGWGIMCVSEALCFSSSHKQQETVRPA